MDQGRVVCGVFQETNLIKGVYAREMSGFWLIAMEELSDHHNGVAIFKRKAEHFAVKELRIHGPNIISSDRAEAVSCRGVIYIPPVTPWP